jgi:hypothetical protein
VSDLEGAFRDVTDDFEWVVPGHPEGAVRRGPRGAIAFLRDWLAVRVVLFADADNGFAAAGLSP